SATIGTPVGASPRWATVKPKGALRTPTVPAKACAAGFSSTASSGRLVLSSAASRSGRSGERSGAASGREASAAASPQALESQAEPGDDRPPRLQAATNVSARRG